MRRASQIELDRVVKLWLDAQLAMRTALKYHSSCSLLPDSDEFDDVFEAWVSWGRLHACVIQYEKGDEETMLTATVSLTLPIGRRSVFAQLHVPEDYDGPRRLALGLRGAS